MPLANLHHFLVNALSFWFNNLWLATHQDVVTHVRKKLEGFALTASCMSPCTHHLLQTTDTNINLAVCLFVCFFLSLPLFLFFLPTNITMTHQMEEQRMKQRPIITVIILMVVLWMTCGNKVAHTHNITYRMLQYVYEIISFNSQT
jgi:hypothetical protein